MPSPPSRHHAEWLSLLEISGPFLSLPVLLNVFPQGLDDFPSEEARSLRADYEFWKESAQDPAVHTAWLRLVMESMLGYSPQVLLTGQAIPAGWKADFPEHDETLRPDMVLAEPGTHMPRLLIQVYPPGQSLEKSLPGSRWQASIATRMMELLHATEVRLGLLTNGEQWMLVDAPRGETTGFTTWHAGLWFDEPLTLRAWRSLLGVGRFFGVAADQTLESLLAASAQDQQEITDQLGLQVRHAVEILVQMIDRADQDSGGKLLGIDVPPALLYEAALTFMMRLVFMLSAEERRLLPLDDSLYAEYYAVSTLRAQLREAADQQGEEVLERRFDAWSRLLAAFRAVHAGIRHDRLMLPPYGGSLFNPHKYPFLEGRPGSPLPVNNRTVLHLLDALQMLQTGGEARRLSFRALDVEQIGHVYEGLLDHTALRAGEAVLGLRGAKRQEPEIALAALEQAAGKPEADFLAWLNERTGRSTSVLKNVLAAGLAGKDLHFLSLLRSACGNNERLVARLLPFAGLLRQDDFSFPVVILPGSVYVTSGTTRRATGTHLTPRSLTEPVVQHTLEPLVYLGPAEGLPKEQWRLRSPRELLALKICDLAMGSGGMIVQADRYLAERLVEAWEIAVSGQQSAFSDQLSDSQAKISNLNSKILLTPEGDLTDDPARALPPDPEERLLLARRLVAERCLYGVDKNPLAVEIAKLSLWLITLSKDRPFTFLDHALKCGDSLVGASQDDFQRWAHRGLEPSRMLDDELLLRQIEDAREKRRELEAFTVRDVRDAERKAALLAEAEAALQRVKVGCDLLVGVRLLGLRAQEAEDLQLRLLDVYREGKEQESANARQALAAAHQVRAFHWEFEFPEVFEQGGFSAFVGNPPFIGGQRLTGQFGSSYRDYLVEYLANGKRGSADICTYFFLQAFSKLIKNGTFGLVATNTIAQGDTREVGLDQITSSGGVIFRAVPSMIWPGTAAVYVGIVHLYKGKFRGQKTIDGNTVSNITALLDSGETQGNPYRLKENSGKSFQGSNILGIGFVIEPDEALSLIQKDSKNTEVVFPYLIGEDLNSQFDQSPSRWVINFFDYPLDIAEKYLDCMEIVRKRVKPDRDRITYSKTAKTKWWQYERIREELYATIAPLRRVLVIALTSKTLAFVFMPKGIVYSHATVVLAYEEYKQFTLLQSTIHTGWARKFGSSMKGDARYTPTDCFENFPFPSNLNPLNVVGETYHEHRRQIMLARQEGLTTTYNRFHNPQEHAGDITRLRALHVEMDQAVAAAYGWHDLDLGHGFHESAQGMRYTISEAARREVLGRLLKLNHERYEEEVMAGLHEKGATKGAKGTKGAKKGKASKKKPGQIELF